MILDTDCVGDDVLAIFYAAKHPQIQLEAVTVETGAAGSLEQGTNVALNTLDIAGRSDVPVAQGTREPIVGHPPEILRKPVEFADELEAVLGKEALKGFNPPEPAAKRKPIDKHAIDVIIDTVRAHPHEITLVTTGPVTNVALAFQQDPEVPKLLKELIIMGGAYRTPGNITPVVEYNIWADPEASRVVMNAPVRRTLVPLDVCENNDFAESMLTRDVIREIRKTDNPVTRKIEEKFPVYIDIWRGYFGLVGFPLDDVIAVALAIEPSLATTIDAYVDVELEGQLTRGQTVVFTGHQIVSEPGAHNTHVCVDLDARAFLQSFIEVMQR